MDNSLSTLPDLYKTALNSVALKKETEDPQVESLRNLRNVDFKDLKQVYSTP
jgi:hypothetical protein